jgi:hypothetical protein
MVGVCDIFDYEDYPVYVMNDEDVRKVQEHYKALEMQKVM